MGVVTAYVDVDHPTQVTDLLVAAGVPVTAVTVTTVLKGGAPRIDVTVVGDATPDVESRVRGLLVEQLTARAPDPVVVDAAAEVDDLSTRVARLEAAVGLTPGGSPS